MDLLEWPKGDEDAKKEIRLWDRLANLTSEQSAKTAGLWADLLLRIAMAYLFYLLASSWLDKVLNVLDKQQDAKCTLSDTVLVTLLTTTTINVLSLLAAVALYLFPKAKKRLDEIAKQNNS